MSWTPPEFAKKRHGYSAHGWHELGKGLVVYHQGGFDTYCGFHAILNLINFLKFKEDSSNVDFIGADNFREFRRFIDTCAFDGPFPKRPFGDDGLTQKLLVCALSHALKHFEIAAKLYVEEILPQAAASVPGLVAAEKTKATISRIG